MPVLYATRGNINPQTTASISRVAVSVCEECSSNKNKLFPSLDAAREGRISRSSRLRPADRGETVGWPAFSNRILHQYLNEIAPVYQLSPPPHCLTSPPLPYRNYWRNLILHLHVTLSTAIPKHPVNTSTRNGLITSQPHPFSPRTLPRPPTRALPRPPHQHPRLQRQLAHIPHRRRGPER